MSPAQTPTPNISWRPGRYGRKKPPAKKDATFVGNSERAVKAAADNVARMSQDLSKNIGERPFGTQKLNERQQVRRYSMIRDDQQMWAQLIQQHSLKQVIDYYLRMERLSEKYPEDANYVNPEPKIK